MTVSIIQIGLHPDVIDYDSPDFAAFPGLTPERLQAAHEGNMEGLRELGYDVDGCQVDTGETAEDVLRAQVRAKRYDAILLGAGIRLVASQSLLCERLVNLLHVELPDARFVFNAGPRPSPTDVQRYFPDPTA